MVIWRFQNGYAEMRRIDVFGSGMRKWRMERKMERRGKMEIEMGFISLEFDNGEDYGVWKGYKRP